nr:ATP-grasp domain-containing protein [Actinomycetales bacterium]
MVNVTVLVEERYRQQAQPTGLVSALLALGASVRVLGDDELPSQLGPTDVVVARGRSEALLEALRQAEAAGYMVLDPAAAVAAVRDKAAMATVLERTGLPLPQTWTGTGPELATALADLAMERIPRGLIAKPVLGDNSRGIYRIGEPNDLATIEGDLVVQEFVPGTGADLKLYAIGSQVWAVRKPSPVTACLLGASELGAVEVTPRLRELALECGAAFGLTMFGVDCVEAGDEVVVIEVNDFPNYTHVPQAGHLLARHVLARAA